MRGLAALHLGDQIVLEVVAVDDGGGGGGPLLVARAGFDRRELLESGGPRGRAVVASTVRSV